MWWDSPWDFREVGRSRRVGGAVGCPGEVGAWWGYVPPLERHVAPGDPAFPWDVAFVTVELLNPFQPGVSGEERIHSWMFW